MSLVTFIFIALALGAVVVLAPTSAARSDLVRRVGPADVRVWNGGASVPDAFREKWERDWAELLSHMREGDELWEFSDFPKSERRLSGCAGYVIVRDGKPTNHRIVTVIS